MAMDFKALVYTGKRKINLTMKKLKKIYLN